VPALRPAKHLELNFAHCLYIPLHCTSKPFVSFIDTGYNSEQEIEKSVHKDIKKLKFIQDAESTVPPQFARFAGDAARWVAELLGTDNRHRQYVSSLAAWMAGLDHPSQYKFPPIPLEFVESEKRADWAKPWAQAVRKELFGTPEPPFTDMASAIAWIESEVNGIDRPSNKDQARRLWEYQLRAGEEFRRFLDNEGLPFDVSVNLSAPSLSYPGKDGWWIAARVDYHPKLRRLAIEADKMARACRWHQGQAVLFVLADACPFVSRASLTIRPISTNGQHGQGTLTLREAELKIRGTDFSERDLKSIFKELRRSGVAQKKPLSPLQAQIFAFIKQHRPPWNKDNPLTWKETLQAWNEANPQHKRKSIRGLYKVIDRCSGKVSSIAIASEQKKAQD